MTEKSDTDLRIWMSKKSERRQTAVQELMEIDLGDPRRAARARLLVGRLAHIPGRSIPDAMGNEAEVEAAYRHLSSDSVTLEGILLPHVLKTKERVRRGGVAYAVHDTTELTFGGEKKREGLGPVNGKDQGFLAHLSLAVSADGERTPLGLLAVGTRVRRSVGKGTGVERYKWALGIEHASRDLPKDALIHLADRECDIFESIAACIKQEVRFIFRAAQDRAVLVQELGEAAVSRLFAAARAAEPVMEVEADVSARGAHKRCAKEIRRFPVRRARKAMLAYSAISVELKRPRHSRKAEGLPESVKVNVVRAWEPNPPEGEPPVEWVLLTNEPVDSPEHIRRVVDGYRTRWVIEEYNKALKSGCAFEQAQLESAHALLNLLGYCLVIAYVLLLMRALSRSKTKIPASDVFTPEQLACLQGLSRRVKLPPEPTADQALLACAGLGGHMKRNGLPGWRTLSRGYARLLEYERGYIIGRASQADCDQS